MAEDTNINAENSDILSMATVMAISRYLATLHEPARSSGVNDTAETESLYAAAQKGGVEWLKKAGLKSVRFTIIITHGDAPDQELRDSIMEWIEREENEIVPAAASRKRKRE
jgi:hypothetical protein